MLSWPWLSGAVTIPYDAKALFQAQLQFLANAIHSGQSPFWTPNVFVGMPQIADPQSLIFSPPCCSPASRRIRASMRSMSACLLLLALGGLAILKFCQDRGWHPAGGIVAALAFAFGASASWRIQHIGQIESLVFFAIALWLLARALDRSSLVYGVLAGIAAGLMVVQPDQVAFLGALFLVGYVADHWLAQPSLRRGAAPLGTPARGRDRSPALLIIAVPLLLTMLFAEFERPRGVPLRRGDARLAPSGLAAHHAGRRAVQPRLRGAVLGALQRSVGSQAPVSVAEHEPGLCRRAADAGDPRLRSGARLAWTREIRFFSLALLVLIVYALGHYTPAFRVLFDLLPGVSAFRRPADATFLIGAATAILGGYLVHRVASGTVAAAALGICSWRSRCRRMVPPLRSASRSGPGIFTMPRCRSQRPPAGSARPLLALSAAAARAARATSLLSVLIVAPLMAADLAPQQRAERIDRAAAGALRHAGAGHARTRRS